MKKVHQLRADEVRAEKEFQNEVTALIDIRHRNIVKFYGSVGLQNNHSWFTNTLKGVPWLQI